MCTCTFTCIHRAKRILLQYCTHTQDIYTISFGIIKDATVSVSAFGFPPDRRESPRESTQDCTALAKCARYLTCWLIWSTYIHGAAMAISSQFLWFITDTTFNHQTMNNPLYIIHWDASPARPALFIQCVHTTIEAASQ